MPTFRFDPQSGFTLIELLLVIAILGLFSAGAAQYMSRNDPAFELRTISADIEATLRQARSTALVENRSVAVTFDIANRWYGAGQNRNALSEKFNMRVVVAGREQIDDQTGAIRFYPDGAATGGSIYVSDAWETHGIEVDWLTGRVEFENEKP